MNVLARLYLEHLLRREFSPAERAGIMGWLTGKKELLSWLLGAIYTGLGAAGWLPDVANALKPLHDAVAGGNWIAAFSTVGAVVSAVAMAARAHFVRRDAAVKNANDATAAASSLVRTGSSR